VKLEGPDGIRLRRDRAMLAMRGRLGRRVKVDDGDSAFVLECESPGEFKRAGRALVQEEGTVEWIRAETGPGDAFFDVGANIGIFTIMAARRVGPEGHVYAFEPHAGNVVALLRNVAANGLDDRVTVMSCALSAGAGYLPFAYRSLESGDGLGEVGAAGRDGAHSELKATDSADRLVEQGVVRPPTLVKIDVEGHEQQVLQGMSGLLSGDRAPRSLQIELKAAARKEITAFLSERGFRLETSHLSYNAKLRVERGKDPELVSRNAIFGRA